MADNAAASRKAKKLPDSIGFGFTICVVAKLRKCVQKTRKSTKLFEKVSFAISIANLQGNFLSIFTHCIFKTLLLHKYGSICNICLLI